MAEPMFKLLRCDAEALHMIGWAKKEVRRLVNYAGLDAFNRTWTFGDVSVRAQYFGGIAQLWLEAEATERMWFGFGVKVGMPSTIGVQILRRQPPLPTLNEWSDPYPTAGCLNTYYDDYSYEGTQFSTGAHTVNTCGAPSQSQSFQDYDVTSGAFWAFIYATVPPLLSLPPAELWLPTFTGLYTYDASLPTNVPSMSGSYGDRNVPAAITAYGTVEVRLTDGTLLASVPHKRFFNAVSAYPSYAERLVLHARVTNQPKQEVEWSGGGSLPLYDRYSAVWQPSQTLSFEVPADVAVPASTADWNDPSWYHDTTHIYFNDADGVLVNKTHSDGVFDFSDSSPWAIAWRSGREQTVLRERARRLAASNALLDELRNKRITAELKEFLKVQYPRSARTVRTTPLRVVSGPTYTRITQTTTYVSPTYSYVNYERWEGRCTLAYTVVTNEGETEHEKEYVGYCEWTKPVVSRRTPMGNAESRHEYYTEYVYDNFPLLNSYGSAFFTVPAPGVQFLRAAASVKNLIDAGEVCMHDELDEPLFGVVNGTITHCPSWVPTDDGVFDFAPVYTNEVDLVTPSPESEVNVVFDHTQWFREYLVSVGKVRQLKKDEAVPAERTQFLSSALPHGTTTRVVPLSAMAGDEERGMFPYPFSDLHNYHAVGTSRLITGLKIYGHATVTYNDKTDAFTLESWTELPTPKILDIAEAETKYGIDLSSWLNTNCVCLGTMKWDDLQSEAKEQREDMKDPATLGGFFGAELCLYAEVKAALTPQE